MDGGLSPRDPAHQVEGYCGPPWSMKSRAFAFVMRTKSSPTNIPPNPHGGRAKDEVNFAGGMGFVLLVRYTHSPIGPYNELAVVPGNVEYKGKRYRHANILYVSTEESVQHGRGIWGLPKNLARFDWSVDPSGVETVAVTLPNHTDPFFRVKVQTSGWKIPFSTSWLPSSWFKLLQVRTDGSGSVLDHTLTGFSMSTKLNMATLENLDVNLSLLSLEDSGQDLVWSRGLALHDTVGQFGSPEIV